MAYTSSLFSYIAVASFIALGWSQSCDPSVQPPLVIPIHNVSLQAPVVRRGAAVSIGTPPQTFAFSIDPYGAFPASVLSRLWRLILSTDMSTIRWSMIRVAVVMRARRQFSALLRTVALLTRLPPLLGRMLQAFQFQAMLLPTRTVMTP